MIEVTAAALATHPFLHGMPRDQLGVLAGISSDIRFPARHRIFEDGGNATRFWLIQSGHVSLDLHVPGEGPVVIETIGMGELLGWSWLFSPYRWAFGAVAATPVEAFEFDAPAVREARSGPRRKSPAAAANGPDYRASDGVRLRTRIRYTTRRRLLSIGRRRPCDEDN